MAVFCALLRLLQKNILCYNNIHLVVTVRKSGSGRQCVKVLLQEANVVKYLRQFGIILGVTCAGEVLKYFIPLSVPGSIYGLILMFILLFTGILKVEHVKETGEFLIEIMPLMFIPAGVGLLTSWSLLQSFLVPLLVITVVSTFVVMIVTGKVTDFLISRKEKKEEQKNG